MRIGVRAFTFCGLLLLGPAILHGQDQSIELGVDAEFSLHTYDPTTTRTSIPKESVRLGLFVSNRVSIEPSVSLTVIDGQNTDPTTSFSFWLSGLYHITVDRSRPQPFVRPTAAVEYHSVRPTSPSQYKAGGYFGLKLPVANHMSCRLEAGYLREFESENLPASDELSLTLGISLFVR